MQQQKVDKKDDASELAKCLRGDYGLVWSHCDLNNSNILVDPITFKITAILDWEKSHIAPPVCTY
jgi:thiamine kinase-like enzyme